MILHCIRHGESRYNAEGRLQGQSATPLSDVGRRQAAAIAAALADRPIAAVYASPLARTMETAEPLASALGVEIHPDPRLMEINVGRMQDLLHVEVADRFPEELALWRTREPDYALPGGESRRELMVRGEAALADILAAGHAEAAVVSHGGLLAVAFCALIGVTLERNPFLLYNASISQLSGGNVVRLLTLNQTDHLRAAGCETINMRGDFV